MVGALEWSAMKSPFSKTMLIAMFSLTFAATACAVGAEDEPASAPDEAQAAENTGTMSEELSIGGGSLGGSTSLWCASRASRSARSTPTPGG